MAYTISTEFKRALQSPKQKIINKIDLLDAVTLGRISSINGIDDGVVSVAENRATRRTAQLRLSNTNDLFSLIMTSSYFFVGNVFRVYTGLQYYSDTRGMDVEEYVPVGTFIVDRPEVFSERGMSVITVDGSDFAKRLSIGGFHSSTSFGSRVHVNTIIRAIANDAYIPPSWIKLDPLLSRTTTDRTVEAGYAWQIGEDRIQKLETLGKDFGLSIYFDTLGHLVTTPVEDEMNREPVWEYTISKDSTMLGVTKIQDDLNLFNHIVIYTENAMTDTTEILYSLIDDDPMSVTYYGRIGKRTLTHSSASIWTAEQARYAAYKLFIDNCVINEKIKLTSVRLPQIETGDMILINEPVNAHVYGKYRVESFDVSLRDGRMVIDAKQTRKIYGT